MVDKYAPIIPYKEMGNIKLYSSMAELSDVISISKEYILNDFWIRYDVDNIISLFFHRKNSKLFKMTTLEGYCGDLFEKINVNTPECDITTLDDSFKYDEFDEVWESNKGVFIEIDPLIRKASWITIYIKELDNDDFDEAKWWLVHLTVNGEEIVTTVDHPFYVKNQGFIKAGELIVGDELLDVNGNVLLVEKFNVELTDKPVKVYNFQVEDFHTYHVGRLGVLVHNAGKEYGKQYSPEQQKLVKEGKNISKINRVTRLEAEDYVNRCRAAGLGKDKVRIDPPHFNRMDPAKLAEGISGKPHLHVPSGKNSHVEIID